MEELEQPKVPDNYLLYYQGSDGTTKTRIVSETYLTHEFIDKGRTKLSTTLRIYKLLGDVASSVDTYRRRTIMLLVEEDHILDIIPSGILLSWQNYFNSSSIHHWKHLCDIIKDCMSKEVKEFNLNLQEHLSNVDPDFVSAVITLEDFTLSEQFMGQYYKLYYKNSSGSILWRFLSKSCITEAQSLPTRLGHTPDDISEEWLNVLKTTEPKNKQKLQIKNPFDGECDWDDVLYNMNSGRCLSLFTDIENYFNDPELNKVIYIDKD